MNTINLIGRLTSDPELKFINSNIALAKFTLAIDRSYKKDNQTITDFIPIEVWNKRAEYCANYIKKGYLVAIIGTLHIDRYVDITGVNKYYAKVIANSIAVLNTPKYDTVMAPTGDVYSDAAVAPTGGVPSNIAIDPANNIPSDTKDDNEIICDSANITQNFTPCDDDDELPF